MKKHSKKSRNKIGNKIRGRNKIQISRFAVLSIAFLFALFFFSYTLNAKFQPIVTANVVTSLVAPPAQTTSQTTTVQTSATVTKDYTMVVQEESGMDISGNYHLEKGSIVVPQGCQIAQKNGIMTITSTDNAEQGLTIGGKVYNNVKGTFTLDPEGNLYKADFSLDEKGGVYELPGLAPIEAKGVKINYFNQEVSEMTSYQRMVNQQLVDDILIKKPMGNWPYATIFGKGKSFNYRSNSINILDEEGVTINGETTLKGDTLGTSHIDEYINGKEFTINDIRCINFKRNYCNLAITDKGYELLEGSAFYKGVEIDVQQFKGLKDTVLLVNPDADVSNYDGNWIKISDAVIDAKSAKGSFIQIEAMNNNKAFGVTDEDVSVKIANGDIFNVNYGKITRKAAGLYEKEGYTRIQTGELDLMVDDYGHYTIPHYKKGITKSAQLDIDDIIYSEQSQTKGGPITILEEHGILKTNSDNSYFLRTAPSITYDSSWKRISPEYENTGWYYKIALADEPDYKTTIFKRYSSDGTREYEGIFSYEKAYIPYEAYTNTRELMDVKLDQYDFYTKNAFKSAPAPPGWDELKEQTKNKIVASTFVYDINKPDIVRGRFTIQTGGVLDTKESKSFAITINDKFQEISRPSSAADWFKPSTSYGYSTSSDLSSQRGKTGEIIKSTNAFVTYNLYYELPPEISSKLARAKGSDIDAIYKEFEENKDKYYATLKIK
jgi:hypothetical protein